MSRPCEPCSEKQLQYLNERYEYRILATSVIDHVLLRSGLSDAAKILWLNLYRLAALKPGMKTEASATYLKVATGKSESTIWRLIKELREGGYLLVVTRNGTDGESLPNIYGPRLPMKEMEKIRKSATPREVISKQITAHEFEEIRKVKKDCPATVRDSNNKINEYRDYPGLCEQPDDISETIRDYYKDQIEQPEYIATIRDYDFQHSTCEEGCSDRNLQPKPGENVPAERSALAQNERKQRSSDNTAIRHLNALRNALTSQPELTKDTHSGGVRGDSQGGRKSGTQSTKVNKSPTEICYTTTGAHSRDSWKMFPHIRLQVKTRLEKMGIAPDRVKTLLREIDWSLKFGSMEWWPVQKGINVCLNLIQTGRWVTPRF